MTPETSRTDQKVAYARRILWRRVLDDRSHEYFELSGDRDAATMTGWIVAEHDRQPALITYQLLAAPDLARARTLDVVAGDESVSGPAADVGECASR